MSANPLLGTLDPIDFDNSYRPQDDLFRYVNGKWLKTHEIPADRPIDGSFYALRDLSEERTRAIVDECACGTINMPEAKLVGELYGAFMDEKQVDADWAEAFAAEAKALRDANDKVELARALGALDATGVSGLIGTEAETDPNHPDVYTAFTYQDGLGLPERAYYLEGKHAEVLSAYREHIAKMWQLAGWAEDAASARTVADLIVAFEKRVAEAHWDIVRCRDAQATNNPMSFTQLAASAPGYPWEEWREATGYAAEGWENLLVMQPDYFTKMAKLWEETYLEDLRVWALWMLLHDRAPLAKAEIVEENFAFYGRTLAGTPELKARWKRGVSLVEGVLGEAIGKIYVERHFPPENLAKMQQLVADLVEAYRESISELDWLGADTRAAALEKLAAFTPKIGYPEKWRDYSGLDLSSPTLLGKAAAASRFEAEYWWAKVGQAVDKTEWLMTPQTVNAYYHPIRNEIVFPAAILQPPFFDPAADPAINYASIGAVIGHEIGHGFDDQGSRYDGTGQLKDWWTETDRAKFEERTKSLISQYENLVPEGLDDEHHVQGALTIGENIGDLGGLTIAWKAYLLHLKREGIEDYAEAPVIDGLSATERFFYAWARIWQSKGRPEYLQQLVAVDPHSPSEFRCNQVARNLDLFHSTFATANTDAMWLDPGERVTIW